MTHKHGFTLLEVLLSVALMSILAGLSVPVSQRWIQSSELEVAESAVRQSLRRAQVLSQGIQNDSSWGVSIDANDNNQIILFQGDSFAGRDSAYDEIFDFGESLSASGLIEIVFNTMSGTPQITGTATLTSNTGEVRNISINEKGIVSN